LADIFACGCEPIWTAAEKRYCVAAKIVETFFDPFYNPNAIWLPTGANASRQRVAEVFHSISVALLNEFLEAYRNPDVESLRTSAKSLYHAMKIMGQPLLAKTLLGAVDNIAEIADAEECAGATEKRFASISLNLPIFWQFISHADRHLKARGANRVHVTHDKTSEFEAAFTWAFKTLRNAKKSEIELQNGTKVYIGFDTMKKFRTGNSQTEPGIQGADLLASALRKIFIAMVRDGLIDPEMTEIAGIILGQNPKSPIGNFWLIGSNTLWINFARHFNQYLPARGVA
jgi:hypothetical protein